MIISKKYICLRLPKTASTHLRDILNKIDSNVHISSPAHRGYYTPTDKKIIGGIRNPWDWYVSWWGHMIKSGGKKNKRYKDFKINTPQSLIEQTLTQKEGKVKTTNWTRFINFKEMNKMDIGILTTIYIKLYYPNHQEIFNKLMVGENIFETLSKGCNVDYFYKMESLDVDISDIFKKIGVGFDIEKKLNLSDKTNTSIHKEYKGYYNKKLKELVAHKERFLIKKYNYNF